MLKDFGYVLGGFAGQIGDWLVRTEPDSLSVIAWILETSEDSLDFGEVTVDSSSLWELILTNAGERTMEILSITCDSAAFSVEFEDVLTLEPDDEASIPVTFHPTEPREYSGSLLIHTYWRDYVVGLTGTGAPLSVVDDDILLPEFALYSVYPNPFNNIVQIEYTLPCAAHVQLSVFDIEGRLVQNLVNSHHEAGQYSAAWQAQSISAGVYFLRLEAGSLVQTRKVTLLK
jgi:hypothetical protein